MPTFLTEFTDPEEGRCTGPYIVADSFEEAELVAKRLIMDPDGIRVTVLGELAEQIPADMNITALRLLQQQVQLEVNQIVHGRAKPVAIINETADWERVWRDEPKDDA